MRGICRMMLTEMGEHVTLYTTPLNIDPENPAMPISHPSYYATYLAKRVGPYATLGLAEDTWALNEGVIDDGTFLKLTYDIDKERKDMFWASLERQRGGTITCVFDATDRIQHMFWRYTEEGHPAAEGIDPGRAQGRHREALPPQRRLRGRGPGRSSRRATCSWSSRTTASRLSAAAST